MSNDIVPAIPDGPGNVPGDGGSNPIVDPAATVTPGRARRDLFLISLLILFLELACIRWFPAHVLFLTFFTNTVLLACFLGMSLGCLAAGSKRNYLVYTPYLLLLGLVLSLAISSAHAKLSQHVDISSQDRNPGFVFFGTEHISRSPDSVLVPIEAVGGGFFVLIALIMVGPGQELGRALTRLPGRIEAYTIDIVGSIVGISLFATVSWFQLPPLAWFLPVVVGLGYFLLNNASGPRPQGWQAAIRMLALVLLTSGYTFAAGPLSAWYAERPDTISHGPVQFYWSPYYRLDYYPRINFIEVNLIGHQQMVSRQKPNPAYALPHLWNRDSGGKKFKDILIIGAGSGNDVSRAIQWGDPEVRIDAVEIDPRIQALGKRDHPDKPYDETDKVNVTINDGRNFLRSTEGKYDLVVFALVDSLVLHSGYSNIRMESYLFTKEAMEDVKRHLKPGGLFVMYNYFRQGWIVARLQRQIEEVFKTEPLVLTLPFDRDEIQADDRWDTFTILIGGEGAERIRAGFAEGKQSHVRSDRALTPDSMNSFTTDSGTLAEIAKDQKLPWAEQKWYPPFRPSKVVVNEDLRLATDDWPFLYLRQPMIPLRPSLSGMVVMLCLAIYLLYRFLPRSGAGARPGAMDARMFFLGAGFMLIETKAVVHMALLFGSTWMVNSIVFLAVLVMILLANLFVLTVKPRTLWPYYVGLVASLALNVFVPLDFFLGMDRLQQILLSCSLVFAPIAFAGVVFAVSFARTEAADRAFGFNIAGAMVGGLLENTSMILGFQHLMLLAIGLYLLSSMGGGRQTAELPKSEAPVPAGADS